MMVEAIKNISYRVLSAALLLSLILPLSACSNGSKVINTHAMPGHKVSDLIQRTNSSQTMNKKDSPVSVTKSGVYIYKDNSMVNTTGYRFQVKDKTDVGPNDVRFDAEHFKTRY